MKKENAIKELEDLIYDNPKCSFEHAWNCALDKAIEALETYEE